ncbi:MAG: M50 family metallopeptidase [Pseudomonadota bacterium]
MSFADLPIGSLLVLPLTLMAFIVLLTIIVFIHEYGHFSVARALGVRVDVFSIGFGKTLLKWVDRKGTEWRIALLPLGGYVKFFGDLNAASQASPEAQESGPVTTQFPKPGEADDIGGGLTAEEKKVCFHFKPVWARAAIVAAGPFANFILAIVIFAGLFMTFGRGTLEPVVGGVQEGSAAAEAGLMPGDRMVSANGRTLGSFSDLADSVLSSGGDTIQLQIERDGAPLTLQITPRRVEAEDRYGNTIEKWLLGVSGDSEAYSFQRFGFFGALKEGAGEVVRILSLTVKFIGQIILGKEDTSQLGGPIKMAQYAGQSAMSGFDESGYQEPPSLWTMLKVSLVDFISLAAVVSVSIGFLNLLPVPVLDGGHLMYYAYEAIAGKPLGARAQAIGFRVGLVLLASLMIFVTWNDITNLIESLS